MRLLFVEDEPDLREVLKKQLQGSGSVSYTHLTLPTNREV